MTLVPDWVCAGAAPGPAGDDFMAMVKPGLQRLRRTYDDSVLHVHEITEAVYGISRDGGGRWLTFHVRCGRKLAPAGDDDPVWLEINLRIDDTQEPRLAAGTTLVAPSCDPATGDNLTSMYSGSHLPFEEARIHIESAADAELTARITGEWDDDPVVLRARFVQDGARNRSFR